MIQTAECRECCFSGTKLWTWPASYVSPRSKDCRLNYRCGSNRGWKIGMWLGKRLVVAKGCVNCHAVQPNGKKIGDAPLFTALDDLKKADKANLGCLANDAAKRGKAPDSASPPPTATLFALS